MVMKAASAARSSRSQDRQRWRAGTLAACDLFLRHHMRQETADRSSISAEGRLDPFNHPISFCMAPNCERIASLVEGLQEAALMHRCTPQQSVWTLGPPRL